jgi:protoporphyrinogen/coproporphyrinogen III oxidase
METEGPSVAVIGAGIAGLTAAWRLQQAGLRPVVFEAADYAGGRIKSLRRNGFVFDVGAFIYLGSYTDSIELMREAGLESKMDRFDAYGAMPRDGRLRFLDFNKPLRTLIGTDYLSAAAKLRALKLFRLLLKHWKDLNYDDASGIAAVDVDSVRSYSERELDAELHDYVTSVVVRGPWLCDSREASVAQLLWTMKNFFKPYFYGLDGGMDLLPRALAERLDVRLNHEVLHVADLGDRVRVDFRADGAEHSEEFERCIITTTADRTLAIYPQIAGVQRAFFESTDYISSVNTHLALRRRPQNPATYIMVSPRENPQHCGVIVDHLKARGRVPEGKGMITVFCAHEWCVRHLDAPNESVLQQVLRFIEPYYGDLSGEIEDYEIGRWPRVVPIMREGRFQQVAAYQKATDPRARVQFAGDLEPIGGVNAALVSGSKAAERIRAQYQ